METIEELRFWIRKNLKKLTWEDKIIIAVTTLGIALFISTVLFLSQEDTFQFMFIVSIMIAGLPYALYRYWIYARVRKIEKYLPDYLRDVSESIKAGVTLPRAIETSTKGVYGPLSEEMEKTAAQISWGVPFEDAMRKFAKRTKSPLTKRAVTIIIETYKSGGDIAEVLETVGKDVKTLKMLRAQRKSKLKTYLYSTYFVFFIFLGVIGLLTVSFVPATPDLNKAANIVGGTPTDMSPREFKNFFFHLALIQAFFAGLIGGQMGTGKIIAGIKHSVVMISVTLIVFQVLLVPPGFVDSVASEITKIPPNTKGIESSSAIITLKKDVKAEKVADRVREIAEAENLEGYDEVRGENIMFIVNQCVPCQEGRIKVKPKEITVEQTSDLPVKVISQGKGSFQVQLGGSVSDQGTGGDAAEIIG